ncbi:GTPase IMAP family member 4 [Oncorhynchus kisutch]|uniref:GTPase IMAP family member 4 n=1 Tax=Oncorhynchus kisutch TaxID=8019 RepID=A0A8C7F5K5_ONCKI|nr:GTPase IMAP family member 4 [Oncorhynchus kisutch]
MALWFWPVAYGPGLPVNMDQCDCKPDSDCTSIYCGDDSTGLWLDFNSVLTGALTVVGYLLYRFSQALPALIRWPIHLFCTLTGVSSLWGWVSHLMGTLRSLQYLLKWLSRIWRFIVASFTKLSGFTVIIQNNSGASSDSPPGTEPSPSPISIEPGLRLILTGPPGGGRTSLADALVGCSLPQVGGSLAAVMECTKRRVVVDRRELIIIDTPDLLGPSLGDSKRAFETLRSLQLASPGPHAFLLVLQTPGSGDGVDQDAASATRALLELVGESATGHILIVLTHADCLGPGSTLAQLLEDDAGGLRTALYLCGQRAELVDNNPDKPVEDRRELARGLLERLAEMRALRGHYTHELQKRENQVREELLMDMASVLARKLGQEY